MKEKARALWKTFEKAPAGERFERLHDAQKEIDGWAGIALTVLGVVLVLGGVVLLFIPGPGFLLIAFGAALVAQRSLWLARSLDSVELLARRIARQAFRLWKKAPTPVRALVVLVAAVGSAAAVYGAYVLFFRG